MERRIILGVELDGIPSFPGTDPFERRMGPLGFLSFLETHLGLPADTAAGIERIAALMAILRAREKEFPSWQESWHSAPFAVAKKLLSLLDELWLNGWNGGTDGFAASALLSELGALSGYARETVPPGVGERLAAIRDALEKGFQVPLTGLVLADPIEDWPAAWARVINLFSFKNRDYPDYAASRATLDPARVRLYSFDSAISAARHIALCDPDPGRDVIIAETNVGILDGSLHAAGLPATGCRQTLGNGGARVPSSFQILPLALILQGENPPLQALLDFLVHPLCPLAPYGYCLAEAVSTSAGRSGPEWDGAIARAKEQCAERGDDPARLEALLEEWIPASPAPGELRASVAIRTAKAVRDHFASRKNGLEDHADTVAVAGLALRSFTILADSYATLPKGIVDGIIDLAESPFARSPVNRREAGAPLALPSPGALIDASRRLFWFCPAPPAQAPRQRWTRAETESLSRNGCAFIPATRLDAIYPARMRRALSLAQGQIEIFVQSAREEDPAVLVEFLARKDARFAVETVEGVLFTRDDPKVDARALPPLRRWIELPFDATPKTLIGKDWMASHSQLDTFIYRPMQWVLSHPARIREGAARTLPRESAMCGVCAHLLVERLFERHGDGAIGLDDAAYEGWFAREFPRVLSETAAPFLDSAKALERFQFESTVKGSIRALRAELKRRGAENVQCEKKLEGEIFGTPFKGYVDLFYETESGGTGIIDMKYSHSEDKYRKLVDDETDSQLILYAELEFASSKILPETAYWLFPLSTLVARSGPGMGHDARLERIRTSFDWRTALLADGFVECVSRDTLERGIACTEPERSNPPTTALPPKVEWKTDGTLKNPIQEDRYDPYIGLYGWGEKA